MKGMAVIVLLFVCLGLGAETAGEVWRGATISDKCYIYMGFVFGLTMALDVAQNAKDIVTAMFLAEALKVVTADVSEVLQFVNSFYSQPENEEKFFFHAIMAYLQYKDKQNSIFRRLGAPKQNG